MANKNVHAEQTASEIAREFDQVDWIFVGAGTTGTFAGSFRATCDRVPENQGCGRRAGGLCHLRGAPAKRSIPGIGTSVRPKLADLVEPDRIVVVNEEERLKLSLLRSRISPACRRKHRYGPGRRTTVRSRVQPRRHHRRHIRGSRRKVLRHYL